MAQSNEEGIRLWQEAEELREKARTRKDLQKAVEKFGQALRIFEVLNDERAAGRTASHLGLAYLDTEQHKEALRCYEKSLEIARRIHDDVTEAASLNGLGLVYINWRQYTEVVKYYRESLKIAKKINYLRGQANVLNNWGNVHLDLGRHTKALQYYQKSLKIAKKAGYQKGEAFALKNLGRLHFALGQSNKARKYYEKSLEIAREIQYVQGEGNNLHGLGDLYYRLGQYAKAIGFYEKCLDLRRVYGSVQSEALIFRSLGELYAYLGQYDKAIEKYNNCIEIMRTIGDVQTVGAALNSLGIVYLTQGQYSKALAKFRKALETYEKIDFPTAWLKDSIGNLYLDKGDLNQAERFLKEANYDASLGRFFLVTADYETARKHYESILTSVEESRNANDLFSAHTGLGRCHEGMGDNLKAADHYRKATEQTEDLRSSLNPAERETFFDPAERETFLDVRIDGFYRTAPYEGLARVLLEMNRPLEALRQSEYAKARILAEAISRRGGQAALDPPPRLHKNDLLITDEISALTTNLQNAYDKGNKDQIADLEPRVKEAKERLTAHINMLRKQDPLFAATRYPQPMGLDETALLDHEWVLAYHVTDPGLIIYLTRGRNLIKAVFKPVKKKEVYNLVHKFRKPLEQSAIAITRKDSDAQIMHELKSFDFVTGKHLSDLLLGDVFSDLPEEDNPLIIVPDDSLGVLPFEMLPLTEGGKIATDKRIPYASGAKFFGDRHPVSYYQSITALTLARTCGKHKIRRGKLLVFANPVTQRNDERARHLQGVAQLAGFEANLYRDAMAVMEDDSSLPLTEELAHNLAEMYQGSAECYTGFQATKDNFLKEIAPRLTDYDKIVFATHGYFGKNLPGIKEPVLQLTTVPPGTDGFLRMSEVMRLKMNCEIAALTACQTGLGRHISGEGTMGMGRAFQYAGAKSVLISLWSVVEKSSVQLIESFFQHMKDGKNRLEALRLAKDEIRKSGYDHPFFWAPFILVGEVD